MEKVSINIDNLQFSKEIVKQITKQNYYSVAQFTKDAIRYINAINEGRMFCVIYSVSKSGMTRNLSFKSCEPGANNDGYWLSNYTSLFISLGYKETKEGFRIGGGGLVFYTNYAIMQELKSIGLIDAQTCEILAQKTPTRV